MHTLQKQTVGKKRISRWLFLVPKKHSAPTDTDCIYFCGYLISAELISNTVSYCFIKHGLSVNMPVGGMAVTTGYLGIITMKMNKKLLAAACPCLVILALVVQLLYSAPGLSPEWAQQPSQDCLSYNHWVPWSPSRWPAWLSSFRIQRKIHNQWKAEYKTRDLCGMQTPSSINTSVEKKGNIWFSIKTYIFGSQELHAFGNLVGKAEQVSGREALVHVVGQQVVHVTLWFRNTHTEKTPWGHSQGYVYHVL